MKNLVLSTCQIYKGCMWFFSEEERLVQQSVRGFSQGTIAPAAEAADSSEAIPDTHMKGLADLGLLGITVPEALGGSGMGCVAATITMEELGKSCASTALTYLAHTILVVHNLAVNGDDEQRKNYLPDLIAGKKIAGLGLTEPGSGSDATGMAMRAKLDGDHYILNGAKTFITNGPQGDLFYCYAKTGPDKRDISTFIIEKEMPGFSKGRTLHKMGMRGSPTGELVFENCQVPVKNMVGKPGSSIIHMMRNLDIERITIAGISLGIAESALEVATKYAEDRKQFGKPIGEFQMIQKMIADGDAELAAARSLVYQSAKRYDLALSEGRSPGKREAYWAAQSKLIAAQMATKVSLDAVQILGGYGYMREFPVERYMRDAKLMEIGAGTNEVMRLVIARQRLANINW